MKKSISIIVPLYNAETTIYQTLESLFSQIADFDELIIVNDASSDKSMDIVKDFLGCKENVVKGKCIRANVINHERSRGLASSYNDGIKKSKSELVVTLHSDIILKNDSLKKLTRPFFMDNSDDIVATYHCVIHPYAIWGKYNFWQKCFFSRLVEKKFCGLDGKFDCFRKTALENIGYFDDIKFKNAGEDGDIIYKLGKKGRIVSTEAEIIHVHTMDPRFNFGHIIKKQKQYSEAQGILLRLGEVRNFYSLPIIFFRELLVIGLVVPYIRIISLFLIIAYSFMYTEKVFIKEYNNWRIIILPFLNV